jgi:hypothetical protein
MASVALEAMDGLNGGMARRSMSKGWS